MKRILVILLILFVFAIELSIFPVISSADTYKVTVEIDKVEVIEDRFFLLEKY